MILIIDDDSAPNRYSNTSWNAAKKTNGNKIQIVFPGLRPNVIINQ